MFNLYLQHDSFASSNAREVVQCIELLNELKIDDETAEDLFWKHPSIWDAATTDGDFMTIIYGADDSNFINTALKLLEQSVGNVNAPIGTLDELDALLRLYNAFWVSPAPGRIETDRTFLSQVSYLKWRAECLRDVDPKTLWARRAQIFKKVQLCPEVEDHLTSIGGTFLPQILARLLELDRYATSHWISGEFNYVDANQNSALRISPESKKTMDEPKLKKMRVFALNAQERATFDLHIKTGDLRFHFLPSGNELYVGYIGKHLPTSNFR
jgi:hypothetical protein